jgi:hypothetical protein
LCESDCGIDSQVTQPHRRLNEGSALIIAESRSSGIVDELCGSVEICTWLAVFLGSVYDVANAKCELEYD